MATGDMVAKRTQRLHGVAKMLSCPVLKQFADVACVADYFPMRTIPLTQL